MTFGSHLRKAREAKGISLRKFAKRFKGKPTAAYLSRVERDEVPPPSDEVVLELARELGEDPDVLMVMAGRIPVGLAEIIQEHPFEFAEIIRKLKGASKEKLRKVRDGNW
jgi:HTH-type transcriptional regulator, competence development regulator